MNKRHPYNNIIERKLEQLPFADADHLWNDMHSILDQKMPQQKERRRFLWWFLNGNGILLLSVSLIIISSSSLFFLSKKENSAVTINKLSASQQSNKFNEDGIAKVSRESTENITAANESNQKTRNKIPETFSISDVDLVANNNFITNRTERKSQKYTANTQFNQSVQDISGASENFDITPLNLESIHQGLLTASNYKEEKESITSQPEPTADKKIKMNTKNNNERGFYAGIISGVDLSSIHFKSVKTGASKGFVIGYAFNKKWSLESGLLWDTKRVYDNGSYFNPPGYTPTSGIKITTVNGKSRLYELPVNMKYTILSGKHNLFTTAGLSSYIMRSENYDYEYTQNNQPGGHNYLNYKNETKDWFSVANLSIGYTHQLGDAGNIRIEPYLKLPIKNIGAGNMPVMSTGLNIGYIKKIR